MSGVNLYQLPAVPQSPAITVPSVSKSGLHTPAGAAVTASHVPPVGGNARAFDTCGDPVGRRCRREMN